MSKLIETKSQIVSQLASVPTAVWVSIACLLLAIVSSLLTSMIATTSFQPSAAGKALFAGRNFAIEPFTLMDANELCELEAAEKLGDSLLRYHMNPLSTRYEEEKNRYFVVLNADVGTIVNWSEALIYCDIDPSAHEITYYKEHYDKDSSFFSSAKGLFSKMF